MASFKEQLLEKYSGGSTSGATGSTSFKEQLLEKYTPKVQKPVTTQQLDNAVQQTLSQNRSAAQKAGSTLTNIRSSSPAYAAGQRSTPSTLMQKATGGIYDNPSRKAAHQDSIKAMPEKQSIGKTVFDVADRGAGYFNQGVANTADFVANLLPRAEGAIFGVEPDSTFTGQVLKPVTDATGKLKDYVDNTVQNIDARIQNDTRYSKAAQVAADLGSGIVAALPNAILAMMSGGASAAGTLAPQTTGAAATASAAVKKLASNPMFKASAIQTLGNSYEDAKADGATDEQAIVAAVLSTAFNAAVEVGGGVEVLPGQIDNADLSTGQKALKWVASMLDEGKEEVVQDVISGLTEKAVYDQDRALFSKSIHADEDEGAVISPGRMAQEFGMGAAIGGILGGGQLLSDILPSRNNATPSQTQVDKAIQETLGQNETAPVVETEASVPLLLPEQSEIAKERGYPYSRKDAVYKVVEIPQEKVAEIEAYINTVDSATARKKYKRILKNLFSGQMFTNAGTVANEIAYEIGIGSKGIGEIIARQPVNAQTLAMLEQLNEVVENAKYVASEPTSHENRRGVIRTDIFETDTMVGDQPGTTKMRVNVTKDGNKLYYATNKMKETKSPQPWADNSRQHGVEETASYNNSIPGDSENVNGVGDMGAKTSDFSREVKQSKTAQNTIGQHESRWEVPEEQRVNAEYDAVTEWESLNNARMRLEQDPAGEQEVLRRAAAWSNEEVDMGMLILSDLRMKAMESGDWSQYKDWASVVKQHGVSSGQSLQAWAKYTRRTGDGIMQTVSEILELPGVSKNADVDEALHTASIYADQFDDAVASRDVSKLVRLIQDTAIERKTKKRWGKKLGGEIDWALKRIAKYAEAEVRAAMNQEGSSLENYEFLRNFAAAGIEDIAGDMVKPSAGQKLMTIRRNAMLSKVATIMRNLVGNGAFDMADTFARNVSVPLDMLLSTMTGTRSVAWDRGALSKAGRTGTADGMAKALLEVGLDVNAEGAESKYERSSNRTFKMSGGIVSKFFSAWEKYMGYALNVTDEMAKGSVEARVQQGIDKLYEKGKIKKSDKSLRDGGAQEALYRTFQDDTRLSKGSQTIRKGLNEFASVGDIGLGDVLIPFAQVPANLADRAIDYSPAGLAKSVPELVNVLIKAKKGKLSAAEQAKAVQTLGRNITGSGLIALAAAAAVKGLIRVVNPGGEDENKDKAAYEKMQGQSGTQFNLSGLMRWVNGGSAEWQDDDVLMSIAFLEPFNAHLTIGALLAEDLEQEGQLTAENVLKDTFAGSLAAIADMPMFSAFGDAYDAYQYSDKERLGERILDAGNTLLANEVSSIIPNSIKGIAQGLDPYQRDLYSKEGAWAQTGDQFRAIFDRDSLPIKQDPYGRDMTNEGGVLNFLNTNILPGQITTYRESALDKAIQKTFEETGKATVFPSREAPDSFTVDGETVELGTEQKQKYQQIYGQTELDVRTALYADDLYGNLDAKNEIKAHGYAEDFAKQTAKAGLDVGYEPEDWVKELEGKSPQEVADAIMLKTFESAAENKKLYENKYDGISGLLDSGTINDTVALAIMSDSAVDGYMGYCKKAGVSVADYADVYAYMNKTDDKEKTLEYIEGLNMSKAKKVAIAQGIYGANPTFIPVDSNVPKNWLLEMDATDEIVDQFSENQTELYNTYIRDTGVDMGDYLEIWAFKNSAKSDKDANGKVTYSAKDKTIDEIDKLNVSNDVKRNLFLGVGYSAKNIPWWWK